MSNNQCNDRAPASSTVGVSSSTSEGGGISSGSSGDGVEGEEQEESSSSHDYVDMLSAENALTSFREQWQRELGSSPRREVKGPSLDVKKCTDEHNEDQSTENKAKTLFLKGVEHEQNGKLYEAIQFYRRAVQLVPDIEFRLYDANKLKSREDANKLNSREDANKLNSREDANKLNSREDANKLNSRDDANKLKSRERQDTESSGDGLEPTQEQDTESLSEDEDGSDFLLRLQRVFSRTHCVCIPLHEQKATHMSSLPMEIILYILKWVVSSDLDMRSLEMCSHVCKGFYLCSRDPEIWRLACVRVWGVNCGNLANYASWRQMFIERPRLHFNGCYICKTTYVRHGENSFQDQFYRPWHLVEYYRYLRFFPEGVVLMLTTPDDPVSSLSQLKYRTPKNPAVLVGHYRLHEDQVILVLRRQDTSVKMAVNNRYRNRRREVQDLTEQTFHLELQILNYRKRIHAQLAWQRYSVFTRLRNGQESTTTFELPGNRFPPFWFSRVKSYTSESENPLQ